MRNELQHPRGPEVRLSCPQPGSQLDNTGATLEV
jgi:hypothetical protein